MLFIVIEVGLYFDDFCQYHICGTIWNKTLISYISLTLVYNGPFVKFDSKYFGIMEIDNELFDLETYYLKR